MLTSAYTKNNLPNHQDGFTMIELLVAMAVFFIGIMAAFSLSLNNLNTVKENYNRVIAADLAREGIELVRNIRDSNWLAREANIDVDDSTPAIELYTWDYGLNDSFFTVNYDSLSLTPLNPASADLDTAITLNEARLNLQNNFYTHVDTGQPTGFWRALSLQAICLDPLAVPLVPPTEPAIPGLDCGTLTKIGLKITSRVRYTYGNKTNTIDAVENIYNWRQ